MQTTSSGQYKVVIPKALRARLKLKPQKKLTVIQKDKMLILIPYTSLEALRAIEGSANTSD